MSDNKEHINNFDQSFKNRFEQDGINPPENAWYDVENRFEQIENDTFDNLIKDKFNEGIIPPSESWQNINKATQKKSRKYRGIFWTFLGLGFVSLLYYLVVGNFDSKNEIAQSSIPQNVIQENLKSSNEKNLNEKLYENSIETQTNDVVNNIKKDDSIVSKKTPLKDLKNNNKLIDEDGSREIKQKKTKKGQSLILPARKVKHRNKFKSPELNIPDSNDRIIQNIVITDKNSSSDNKQGSIHNQPSISMVENQTNTNDRTDFLKTIPTFKVDKEPNIKSYTNTESSSNSIDIDSTDDFSLSNIITEKSSKSGLDSVTSLTNPRNIISNSALDSIKVASSEILPDSNFIASSDTIQVKPNGKKKKKKKIKTLNNDSTKKWMVTAYVVPEVQYQRAIKNLTNSHSSGSLLSSNFSSFFEFGAGYTFKNQFQIGLGLSVNKYSYHFEKNSIGYRNSLPIETDYPSGVLQIDGLFGSAKTVDLIEMKMAPAGSDLNKFLYNLRHYKQLHYSEKLNYTSVNIPFDLKWVPGTQRIKPVIKLAGEFNIITNYSSSVTLTFLKESTRVTNHAELRNINFSSSFGFGTQIDLIKGLGITFLPSLNYQHSGIYENPNFQLTPYSIRFHSGLYYKF